MMQDPNAPSPGSADAGIRAERRHAAGIVTLDRPRALNALSTDMRLAVSRFLPDLSRDPQIYGLVLKSASANLFCAGGDVRELAHLFATAPAAGRASLANEYRLIWQLECFSKPSIALLNGHVIGAGAGLSINATHRVAGETYSFAMPETKIGFFPDDGLALTFARMPDSIGLYLGLTGHPVGRADAYRLGLVTHCVPSNLFDEIEALFADAEPVDPLLDSRHSDPGPGDIDQHRASIARCFSADTVADIVTRLESAPRDTEWCRRVAADLQQRSPLALAVSLRHIREAAALDLRLTLTVDYRIACRMAAAPDFAEGVRALLIDRTRDPRWRPATIAEASDAQVERCFATMPGDDLVLPTRQEMQAART